MDAIELRYHRQNTTAFIAERPTTVQLVPSSKVKTAGMGFRYEDGTTRPAQTFRIVEFGLNQTPPILSLTDGKQRAAEFLLIGEWDAAVAVDDHWMAEDGREWSVGDVVRSNGYETRALVVERGE